MVDHEILNNFIRATLWIVSIIGRIIFYYACTIPIFAIASARQEMKIWKKTKTPLTMWGIWKVFVFNVFWMALSLIGSISLVPMWLQRGCGNTVEVEANAVIEKVVSYAITEGIIGTVKIIGGDKLPPVHLVNGNAPAPVFIANHCSQLDVSSVYYAVRRFKWIAKKSVRYIPGPGNIMVLGGHVFIQRTGKNGKSVSNLYELSNNAIQAGVPMMLFPQGTRCMHTNLPFKDGAFRIAAENGSVIVPLTIDVPENCWNSYYPFNLLLGGKREKANTIIITVHNPIPVEKGTEIKPLKQKCQDIIYSALPSRYHGEDGNGKKVK